MKKLQVFTERKTSTGTADPSSDPSETEGSSPTTKPVADDIGGAATLKVVEWKDNVSSYINTIFLPGIVN